jgi:hypothetical protein
MKRSEVDADLQFAKTRISRNEPTLQPLECRVDFAACSVNLCDLKRGVVAKR